MLVGKKFGGGRGKKRLKSRVPEKRHRGGEVERGGQDGVPWGTCGRGVEEEIGGQQAVDCASPGESTGAGFGDCVGGAERGEGNR